MGVLLTGMGEDGAEGLRSPRAGGYTIAEDESTAVVYGMPAAAARLGAVCELLPLPEIGPRLVSPGRRRCRPDEQSQPHHAGRGFAHPGDQAARTSWRRRAGRWSGPPPPSRPWRRSTAAAPDLILLDYYLPGIRGDELCRRIRMNINTRGIPILMMTVEETDEAEVRGLESGADDFVSKSVDADILLLRIRTLLNKARAQDVDPGPGRLALPPCPPADHRRQPSPTWNTWPSSSARRVTRPERAASGQEGLERLRASRLIACWSTWSCRG